ncbi:MAG: 16S rRNA (cytosine(1402)-N(4))-methyltransferase RsmH [Sphingobium sp.]|nr:16S rRNA (cytosine(1402)-N(4))-methyltransferase RsmH [Sphingobium sp.]MBP6112163.1 16S rRNA (cytosine(1402)-N(4))-methyltransferase RsmH [Sphingobium sp.]MBP8670365.1 16S rRNA (cytosine(1402)-N(4))-methyltransferase RsmH [Sphingobium sp.]MBP9157673.1 16S rRNA (cytosine(1402)-N(4))-methyltransferase RsmH [Sphingobium sp.]MCC6482872.1 16S rRNA (cytosine(1402)-N(4))-methyltransferase RsmH [Sphingomonadaceae bacterium]
MISSASPSADRLVAPHIPVLLDEVLSALSIQPGETHVDGTYGAGGYSSAMADAGAHVVAIDRDPDAIAEGRERIAREGSDISLLEGPFSAMATLVEQAGAARVGGVVLDIGVSSMQLDRAERGFSIQADGPLDMRMAQAGMTAADFLNSAPEEEIADVLYRYGEEPRSRRVARAIVAARPIARTSELASVVRRALGHKPHDKKDPATRAFQAIRIHLNGELDELERGLEAAEAILAPGGRLAVVTFHSLEDRIVKQFLRRRSGSEAAGSRHRPLAQRAGRSAFAKPAKAIRPGEAEISRNPRARSATLRSAIRLDDARDTRQESEE